MRSVYVHYNPTTGAGQRAARSPARDRRRRHGDQQALLVSADHAAAIADTRIPADQRRSGKLSVYSTEPSRPGTVDIRA